MAKKVRIEITNVDDFPETHKKLLGKEVMAEDRGIEFLFKHLNAWLHVDKADCKVVGKKKK